MKHISLAILFFLTIYSCTKENQICVTCVGLNPQFTHDEDTRATECAEDSTTAYNNAFEKSEQKGGTGMNCQYTNE